LQELLDALMGAQMNNDTEANNDELWLDEDFRRLYPLSARRLRDLAAQQQEDSAYRAYVNILQSLEAAACDLLENEVLEPEFSPKDHQVQYKAAWLDHKENDE
jgi:hypothetical protein